MPANDIPTDTEPILAYVGLGSNLGQPEEQVKTALTALRDIPETALLKHSTLYRSTPMGPADQPDYINAVAAVATGLTAQRLLANLQEIENRAGRMRGALKWGPRTLDLDLLLYGQRQIDEDTLTVPHPGIRKRPFVLYPLHEIAPDIEVPGLGPLDKLLRRCPPDGLERLKSGYPSAR